MASEFEPIEQWQRVASELRAHKQTQQQAWGDVDNTTLGRYLADELSSAERWQVEQALSQLPELRKLTDLVRDVLEEFDPAAPAPLSQTPTILPFSQPRSTRTSRVFRQRGALLAAASLLLGLGLALGSRQLFTPGEPAHLDGAFASAHAEKASGKERQFAMAAQSKQGLQALPKAESKPAELAKDKSADNWKQLAKNFSLLVASTQDQFGYHYQEEGELDRAEPFLAKATDLRRKSLGDKHPETIKSSQNLAKVYEVALNTLPQAEPYGAPIASMKREQAYENACVLRERITRQDAQEVKQAVVPLLMSGYRAAKTAEDRLTYARALGALGPTAADAVPDLQRALESKSASDEERIAASWSLGRIGAAAQPAMPALMASLQVQSPEVRRAAGDALVQLSPYARTEIFNNRSESLPHDLLKRLQGPEGRSGVNDAGSFCSPHALNEAQRQIQTLARKHHVAFYAETIAAQPTRDAKKDERLRELGNNGIYLLLCKEPPSVEVVVSDTLQKNGFSAAAQAELKNLAKDGVKKQEFDRSLVQSVRYLSQRFEQSANRTKTVAGCIAGGAAGEVLGR